ncbi:MAG: hypothetical protein ACHQUC_09920 [Chlamydiales bacterium]
MNQQKQLKEAKLIHLGRIESNQPAPVYLLLRQLSDYHYAWFKKEKKGDEIETPIWGPTIEEAIRLAHQHWKLDDFHTVNCGFRYTLPERDEHGANALFYQMVASYSSMNGIYFDEELGCNCIVYFASLEARKLWREWREWTDGR